MIFKTKTNKSLSKTKGRHGVPAFFVARFAATGFILFPMGEKTGLLQNLSYSIHRKGGMVTMEKTALGLVEYAKAQLGKPYWYGTFGQSASKSLYDQKKSQYPQRYDW